MVQSKEEKAYLKRKHRGGESNAKGNVYENVYAVFQIVKAIAECRNSLDAVAMQTQLEETYVDDLLIEKEGRNIYHQIKDVKSLTWDSGSSRSLSSDFENQKALSEDRGESFLLKLVHSRSDISFKDTMPEAIKEVTETEHFPSVDDINQIIYLSKSMKQALMKVSAKGDKSTDDELADIAIAFLGAWAGCNNGKDRVTVAQVVEKCKDVSRGYANINIYPDAEISDEVKSILDSIDGLTYCVRGEKLYWELGQMSGEPLLSEDLEKRLLSEKPSDKLSFIKLMF